MSSDIMPCVERGQSLFNIFVGNSVEGGPSPFSVFIRRQWDLAANQRQQRRYPQQRSARQRSSGRENIRRSNSSQQRNPQKRRQNVTKYRRPFHINIGMVIFGIIFLYMLISIYGHFTSSHISPYEVREGSIVVDNTCQGLILREEEVIYADNSGYINYYVRSGEKVSGSSNVYTLDETGQVINSLTENYLDGSLLDSAGLAQLKTSMEAYEADITPMSFDGVYAFKMRMENSILSLINERLFSQASEMESEDSAGMFNFVKARIPGIIEYYTDGFEEVTKDSFTDSMLNTEAYEKRDLAAAKIVNAGDPVYKLITNENWTIIVPLDDGKLEALADKSSVSIRFPKNNLETTAGFEIMRKEGKAYGILSLSNYMVDFSEDRYIDVELMLSRIEGLKIPVTAITEKQFYTIPIGFETTGGDDNSPGFLRETYMEDGSVSAVFVPTTIYETTEEVSYVDCADFSPGDYIVKADSEERFQIGTTASLRGVYNINRGYAVFRKINILYESEEYCIVEEGTNYGLSIYDHIVLDSKAVQEEEIIY